MAFEHETCPPRLTHRPHADHCTHNGPDRRKHVGERAWYEASLHDHSEQEATNAAHAVSPRTTRIGCSPA
jgi:hypothetical protein